MPSCPNRSCRSSSAVKTHKYKSKNRGLVREFLCQACGNTWKEYETASVFGQLRFHDREQHVLGAFALVALGLPLRQIEEMLERKSETITDRLTRCFREPHVWKQITKRLTSDYGVLPQEMKRLFKILGDGKGSFRAPRWREREYCRLSDTRAARLEERVDYVLACM